MQPASIRYKNPGAMWGSALAIKWGASKNAVKLNDGKGQGNNIAVFPTYVQGICAQLDLWRTSKHYRNKKFSDAIKIWSGGNHVESYIKFVLKRVPGMTRNTIMDDAFWRSPMGIAFLKAQAWHEAGKKYPAPAADWIEAQRRVFEKAAPAKAAKPVDDGVRGDIEIWHVQRRLKDMNYSSGENDGDWGGRTGGAISGFINDRKLKIPAPTSAEAFKAILPSLRAELAKAEAEGFTRPIAIERSEATPAELAPKLPEVKAAIQAERLTFWGSISAAVVTIVTGITKSLGEAVELLNPAKEFIGDVPWPVWVVGLLAASGGLYLVSRKMGDAKNAATQAYQEGTRT